MNKPVAVLISDIHYSVHTLKLADAAMRQAIDKANELKVPLIIAGDLHDTKANLRGECVSAMIDTFKQCSSPPFVLIGNHDRINERDPRHSLTFLEAYASVVDYNIKKPLHKIGYLIPYHHDPNELRAYLKTLPAGSQLIMHQGLVDSHMGDYIQDKSAITKDDVAGFRVISGHYHARQGIKLPNDGTWSYIGNPYTTSYGEANDPPKGYQVLMSDGSLEFVPTNLRQHIVVDVHIESMDAFLADIVKDKLDPKDLVWFKIRGNKEQLHSVNRNTIKQWIGLEVFKLDLMPTETSTTKALDSKNLTQDALLDSLIESLTNTSAERKERLKLIWKDLCE